MKKMLNLGKRAVKDNTYKKRSIVHVSFEIGILLKGIHGFLEILGGISLLFLSPDRLNRLIYLLTRQALAGDPDDKLANFLIAFGSNLSISTHHFAMIYLISHGIIKFVLVLLLWRKKLWAYPLTIISLILFIAYQVHRYTFTHSSVLILLTIFDIVMIALTYLEYKRIKFNPKTQ